MPRSYVQDFMVDHYVNTSRIQIFFLLDSRYEFQMSSSCDGITIITLKKKYTASLRKNLTLIMLFGKKHISFNNHYFMKAEKWLGLSKRKAPVRLEIGVNRTASSLNLLIHRHCQLVFCLEYCQSCQSLDFPSLLCLHMPSAASAHAQ